MKRAFAAFLSLGMVWSSLALGPVWAQDVVDDLEVDLTSPDSTVDELPPEPKPSPTPLTEDELAEWEVQNKIPMSRRKKLSSWPGTFFGFRASYLFGAATVPRLGLGDAVSASEDLSFRAPHLGIDMGYTPKYARWGMGISADLSAGMPKSDYMKSAPLHGLVTIYANYVPSRYIRWILGVNVLSQTQIVYFGGQTVRMQGFGFRGGVHFRSAKPSWKPFELFAHAGWVQLTNVSAGFGNNQANYDPRKFLGETASTYNAWFVTGIQYNFQTKEPELKNF